jgi:hypothetical protein
VGCKGEDSQCEKFGRLSRSQKIRGWLGTGYGSTPGRSGNAATLQGSTLGRESSANGRGSGYILAACGPKSGARRKGDVSCNGASHGIESGVSTVY